MSKVIFQTEIIEMGDQIEAFFDDGLFVRFGENVPDTLKDFCYFINVKKVDGTIKAGDKLIIDEKEYLITAVGDIGIAVAQFHEGGVWRRAYARVVSLVCTLSPVAPFFVGQCIGNLRCHQCLASGEHS